MDGHAGQAKLDSKMIPAAPAPTLTQRIRMPGSSCTRLTRSAIAGSLPSVGTALLEISLS